MNLSNANLTRIDTPATADLRGVAAWTLGPVIAVRCVLDEPSKAMVMTLGSTLKNLSAVLYVGEGELGGATLSTGDRVTVELDDLAQPQTYRVLQSRARVLGELTHWECALGSQ